MLAGARLLCGEAAIGLLLRQHAPQVFVCERLPGAQHHHVRRVAHLGGVVGMPCGHRVGDAALAAVRDTATVEALDAATSEHLGKRGPLSLLKAKLGSLPTVDEKKAMGHVITMNRDGSPQVTPVWFDFAGGVLRVNTAKGRVKARNMKDGAPVALTAKEASVLEYLLRRVGEVVPKPDILEHVWDFAYEGGPNVVEVYVSALRRKLGEQSIETIRGGGYRMSPHGR